MAEGSGGRRDALWGIAAGIGLLGMFAGVDRLLQHERDRMAQQQARVMWQQIADVLTNSIGEAPRTLDFLANTIDLDPSGSPEQVVARLAEPTISHVRALVAVGLEDGQGRPIFEYPTGHSLHAADPDDIRFAQPVRNGLWLIGLVDVGGVRQRMALRIAQAQAHLRLKVGDRVVFQSGHLPPQRTASGTVAIGGHYMLLEVSPGARPMSQVRAMLVSLALALAGAGGLTTALGRRALRRRRTQAAALEAAALVRAREVEQERRRYRAFYLRVPVPCASLDHAWRVTDLNDAMQGVLGVPRSQVLGRPLARFMTDECRIRMSGMLRELLRRRHVEDVEVDLLRPDGSVASVRGDVVLDTDPKTGVFHEARLIGIDVTEVETLRRRASEAGALATLGRFAGVISHEVRNPLSVASLANDVLVRAVPTSELRQLCRRQREALRSVERILSESLDFLRAPRLRKSAVDLAQLLRDAVEATSAVAERRGVELYVEPPGGRAEFLADAHKLRQALVNLVENAVQACTIGEGRVRVWGERRAEHVAIHVEDNGSGIPPDRRDRVFEPFFTSKGHGTGLGLAVVKQVIEAHGGEVWFDTTDGQGTRFHVRLPFRPAPLDAAVPTARVAHSHRVLVVEDDPDSREILMGALRDAGHQVMGAASAEEAVDRIMQQPPDLVISDYQLGAASPTGEAVVRAAHGHEPRIPAVLVTGIEAPTVDAEATLYKPLAVTELLGLIERFTHAK